MKLTALTVTRSTTVNQNSLLKSRSDEHKRSIKNCDREKNENAKQSWKADHIFSWDQKKVVDRESRLIPRKIKETLHSLRSPNPINKFSYMLPEIWLPNLKQFLLIHSFQTCIF